MSSRNVEGTARRCPVSMVTDFGVEDPYVGVMKGVILGINPMAVPVDVTHHVTPQAVLEGAFVVQASWRYFPPGTVHLAVVDPGVGTERAPMAVAAGGHFFIGPDNGLFTPVLDAYPDAVVRRIENPAYRLSRVSATFHGRDIFAPAAAWLSRGVPIEELGPPLSAPVRLPATLPERQARGLMGRVIYVDRFGNLVTSIPAKEVPAEGGHVEIAGETIEIRRTYGEVRPGRLLALVGSFGYLEVSVNRGHAAERLGVEVGEPVLLRTGAMG